jgi:hypothetical protein
LAELRSLRLEKLGFSRQDRAQIDRSLAFVQNLLPFWADNVSLTYFNHARTLPISIGG